jgi:hypothetical protein
LNEMLEHRKELERDVGKQEGNWSNGAFLGLS